MKNKSRGWRRFICASDNHGSAICKDSARALFKFAKHWQPDIALHLGDAWDFAPLRVGLRNEESIANDDLEADLLAGFSFVEQFGEACGGLDAILLGNHDARVWRVAEEHSNGLMRMAAEGVISRIEKQAKRVKARLVPYHHDKGVYSISNKLCAVHGYTASVRAVSQTAAHFAPSPGGGVIMGHLHRVECSTAPRHGGASAWSHGCLVDLKSSAMSYASSRLATSQWGNGWSYGVTKGDEFIVWQAARVGGKWLLPTGLEEL